MNIPDSQGDPQVPRLQPLLGYLKSGIIRVPRFQRPFVWSDEQRLDLFESVYRGYPVGSILVWVTHNTKLKCYDNIGPWRISDRDNERGLGSAQYLLDGHQRLTTLYAALGPGLFDGLDESPEQWEDPLAPSWAVYIDLESDEEKPFVLGRARRKYEPPRWLPLSILFDSYKLGDFIDEVRASLAPPSRVNKIRNITDIFRDYKVPVMPIVTEDLGQASASFKRVNTGGTKMTEVHMLNALTWSPDFDLMDELALNLDALSDVGWDQFDPDLLLGLVKLLNGQNIYKTTPEKIAAKLEDKPGAIRRAALAVRNAASELERAMSIRGPDALPYAFQGVVLADALRGDRILSDDERAKLSDWIWYTSLSEFFVGMTSARVERARSDLASLFSGNDLSAVVDSPDSVETAKGFNYRGARSRAIALIMAENQQVAALSSSALSYEDGHTLLAKYGARAMPKLITDRKAFSASERSALDSFENRFLLPPGMVHEFHHNLTGLSPESPLARAHFISRAALSCYETGDLRAFLAERKHSIVQAEEAKAISVGLSYRRS